MSYRITDMDKTFPGHACNRIKHYCTGKYRENVQYLYKFGYFFKTFFCFSFAAKISLSKFWRCPTLGFKKSAHLQKLGG